jgi:branched-chain amino acid transport system permease protein
MNWLVRLMALLAVVAIPALLPPSLVSLSNFIGQYAIVTMGLVLLTGIAGLMSFGQAAFVGLSAYTCAILATRTDLPPVLALIGSNAWLSLVAALLVTGIAAWAIGLLTLRLSGHFLALSTLAWGLSLYYLFGTMDLFGRYAGIAGIPYVKVFGLPLNLPSSMFYLTAAFCLLSGLCLQNLLDSRQGRAIRALKGGIVMAEAMGVNSSQMRLVTFIVAALLAGISGWLYAYSQRFVAPTPFSVHSSINYLFMAVIGGVGNLWGSIAGAGAFTILENWLQKDIGRSLGLNLNVDAIAFGLVILTIVIKSPEGIWPLLTRRWSWRSPAHPRSFASAEPLLRRPTLARGAQVLQIEEVTKAFGGLIANKSVSFDLKAGEIVALIGPNGAGKSTLFNCITGLSPATSGRIRFCGTLIEQMTSREIALRGISRTFQHVRILPEMSVLENVAIGAHQRGTAGVLRSVFRLDRAEEKRLLGEAARQIKRVDLADHIHSPAGDLALGSQRILEIARALSSDPVLLLLDEPAAGLRYNEKQRLAELLRQLRDEGLSVLLVEHDMDFLMGLADHVLVLEAGSKISEGSPEYVQSDPAVIAAYLGGEEE